jgi:secreted PhoX family phosphatase
VEAVNGSELFYEEGPVRERLDVSVAAKDTPVAAERSPYTDSEPFESILLRRLGRRTLLKGTGAGAAALMTTFALGTRPRPTAANAAQSSLSFAPIGLSSVDEIIVPGGYESSVVISWGDPLRTTVPPLAPLEQTASAQAGQFGYNADGLWFMPLPLGSRESNVGLLVVNNEYTNPELMFADYDPRAPTAEEVDIQLAAHGVSIVEVRRDAAGAWNYDITSPYNRRITGETEILITGPAAGHHWMASASDPTGFRVHGTLNNCSSGRTPWGTVLTCEENFHQYFGNLNGMPPEDPRAAVHRRYGMPTGASERLWELYHHRFDIAEDPNEAFRFGWVVEIDPYDSSFVPKKRTALGRFRHEAATVKITTDGRVAVYSGDDERFDYMYKFVSAGRYNPSSRQSNFELLDSGVLYAAKFNDDGTGSWLPLVYGRGPLTSANGFFSQADVVIQTRRAADLLGATPMDRPEDIEPNPVNGRIYCVMTNNNQRTETGVTGVDGANPRPNNIHGHIIELTEAGGDAAAESFTWDIFLLCGNPAVEEEGVYAAGYDVSRISAISSPDNIAFDSSGNLWISTDGQTSTFRMNDGIFAVPTEGPERGYVRQFLSGVPGGEVASLAFTPNDTTLFVSIQHPGEGGTFESSPSLWPDGGLPPKPAIVAVVRSEVSADAIGI